MALIEDKILSVTELTREIKLSLENEYSSLWVEGEISNFKRHTSGHLYFSIKDTNASLRCVMWRGTAAYLQFEPEDGVKVRVFGDVTVYEKQGAYQLRANRIVPLGVGHLEIAFRKLKEKLAAEGLFAEDIKQALPRYPETVGVVTSPTGAAVRDIIVTLQRRWPAVRIVLAPVAVQGAGAAEQIAAAIEDFNRWGKADVLIVGRGGGSLEDLWPFNEEIVARAVYNSDVPVVSAVGHEVDFSICDFVADLRAPTPTAAAEAVVPDAAQVRAGIARAVKTMSVRMSEQVRRYREVVRGFTTHYGLRRIADVVFQKAQEIDDFERRLYNGIRAMASNRRGRVDRLTAQLTALSPARVLQRGYSMTRTYPGERIITNSGDVKPGTKIKTVLADGELLSTVEEIMPSVREETINEQVT